MGQNIKILNWVSTHVSNSRARCVIFERGREKWHCSAIFSTFFLFFAKKTPNYGTFRVRVQKLRSGRASSLHGWITQVSILMFWPTCVFKRCPSRIILILWCQFTQFFNYAVSCSEPNFWKWNIQYEWPLYCLQKEPGWYFYVSYWTRNSTFCETTQNQKSSIFNLSISILT